MIEVALQSAIYDRIENANTGAVGVFDTPPQDADSGDNSKFPYIAMGRVILGQADTQTVVGYSALIRIHTYSRSGSFLECKTIQGVIFQALHKKPLTISGHANFSLLRQDTDCFSDGGSKVHGVCEYRALIEQTT